MDRSIVEDNGESAQGRNRLQEEAAALQPPAGRGAPPAELTVSAPLLSTYTDQRWKVGLRQAGCEIGGTLAAGVSGTVAWSLADKALAGTRFGLVAKLGSAALAGGLSRFAVKGGLETALLDASDRTTSSADLIRGSVDALAAVAAFKAEQAFSGRYQQWLGRSSGAHLSADLLQQQGAKILHGSALQRVYHNGLRGVVGGTVGGFAWATPTELYNHRNELHTGEGLLKAGKSIALSSVLGAGFGGVLGAGGTAVWNYRELAGSAKAAVLGRQGRYALDVYHFNDSHSALLGEGATMTQLAGKADNLRQASAGRKTGSVLIELGDTHSGTAAAHHTNTGEVELRILHQRMRVDGAIPGNHVADTGLPGNSRDTRQWMANMRAVQQDVAAAQGGRELPAVATNVHNLLDPGFIGPRGVYQPYRIHVDAATGERIAMVGLVTDSLQTATPKLVDKQLARAAVSLKDYRWSDLVSGKVKVDSSLQGLVDDVTRHGDLVRLAGTNADMPIGEMVEQVVQQRYLRGLNPEQAALWREWHRLAGRHPEASLTELSRLHPENKQLAAMATHFGDKRVGDLHEVMCTDPLRALESTVQHLQGQRIDKILVLSHLGKSADQRLAAEAPAVSAIFGGHTHDLEPVPLWVWNARANRHVMVSQAGSSSGWLGEANLVFNADGSLHRYLSGGRMHVIGESLPHDEGARRILIEHLSRTPGGAALLEQASVKHPVALSSELPLHGVRGQLGRQTPYGNFLTQAVREGAQSELPAINAARVGTGPSLGENIDVVLLQSGSLRSGLAAGQVDEVALRSIFMNRLTVARMSGEQIERALAYGVHDMPEAVASRGLFDRVRQLLSGFKGGSSALEGFDPSGKFVVSNGLRYQVDRSLPVEMRIKNLMIQDPATGRFVPVDRSKTYTVLTQDHAMNRWGNTPMIQDRRAVGSLDSLPSDKWVFGARFEPAELRGAVVMHDLPPEASRRYVLEYLRLHGRNGVFTPGRALSVSPMADVSPGTWQAPVRPSFPSLGPLTVLPALHGKPDGEVPLSGGAQR